MAHQAAPDATACQIDARPAQALGSCTDIRNMDQHLSERDVRLQLLYAAMKRFDDEPMFRKWILKHARTEEFLSIHRGIGGDNYLKPYRPAAPGKALGSQITDKESMTSSPPNLLMEIRKAERRKRVRRAQSLKLRYHKLVYGLLCSNVDFRCVVIHGLRVLDLVKIVSSGADTSRRLSAVLDLVRLDRSFIAVPPLQKVLREAAVLNDRKFWPKLAIAVETEPRLATWRVYRKRHALGTVQAMGFHDQPARVWAEFFRLYNAKYFSNTGLRREFGFASYETANTVARALNTLGIPHEAPKTRLRHRRGTTSG